MFDARLQLAQFQYSIQLSIFSSILLKRYMRRHGINYFDSPRSNHFSLNNLQDSRYLHLDDHDAHSDRLFATPVRLNKQVPAMPDWMMDPHLLSSQRRERSCQDFFGDQADILNQQQYIQSHHAIQQKVQFSQEEELLINITPQKIQKAEEEEDPVTTIRRINHLQMTPQTESRPSERGLKKYASEAFRFVTDKKKTTYKEVASNLIQEMGDDYSIDKNKKGESNIKRRVYDALNVLIALGTLKRNGNKILGKKSEHSDAFANQSVERQQLRLKEEQMQKQLENLKVQYEKKSAIILAKRQHLKEMKEKVENMKALQEKNFCKSSSIENQDNLTRKISFPVIAVCLNSKGQSPLKQERSMDNEQPKIRMWQQGQSRLYCSFTEGNRMGLMGELDLVARWTPEEPNKMVVKSERARKRNK